MVNVECDTVNVEAATVPRWLSHALRALEEDEATRDRTTALLGEWADLPARGTFTAEARFVVAGMPLASAVFECLESGSVVRALVAEGEWVEPGSSFAEVTGSARALLAGERVALNFLQRLCGVATITRRAVDAVSGTEAVVTDTRKTTPGLRELEKYAVRVGGGRNHRFTLGDGVLWKDNHWQILSRSGRTLADALASAPPDLPMFVEVETDRQLETALAAGVTMILADNQTPETIAAWVAKAGDGVTIEASGRIGPERAETYARAGARRIAIGALTHSPDPAPMRLEIEPG